MSNWPTITGIISDMDGVIYRGDQAIPDAVTAIKRWQNRGIEIAYVTNNSTKSAEEFSQKLAGLGIAAQADRVITTSSVTATFMASRWPTGTGTFVIGSSALKNSIESAEFKLTDKSPTVVVVGLDREINYSKLKVAVRAILNGATLIGTNPDLLIPSSDGFEPGAGCLLKAVCASSGTLNPIIIGKPEPLLMQIAQEKLGTPTSNTIVIGDQLATDIRAANRANIKSLLVLTGVKEKPLTDVKPDFTVNSLLQADF